MLETYNEIPKRYVISNKDKIILVTHNIKSALKLEKELKSADYPKDFCLQVYRPKLNK
jgi:hypothetical protein